MPVRRFHSAEEMTSPPPLPPLTSETLKCAFDLMELAWHLHPVRLPSGVRKFRSREEAEQFRAAWEKAAGG